MSGGGHPLPKSAEARHGEIPEGAEARKGEGDDGRAVAATRLVDPAGTPYPAGDLGRGQQSESEPKA